MTINVPGGFQPGSGLNRAFLVSPASDEIRRTRLDSARQLPAEIELPIATVAAVAGISSQAYFRSLFGAHYGITQFPYRNPARPRWEAPPAHRITPVADSTNFDVLTDGGKPRSR